MTSISDIIARGMLRRLPVETAVELFMAARRAGHAAGCQCRTVSTEKARRIGVAPRWGCVDLRRKILGSSRWRVVYE